jgi:hypothetical protein
MTGHTQQDVTSLLTADFSTTTPVSLTASRVTLMYAMKSYFDYKMVALCGLPGIELRGTRDDWASLRAKIAQLADLLCGAPTPQQEAVATWLGRLGVIGDRLLDTYDGKVDQDWWSKIVSIESFGSGSVRYDGWMRHLFLYQKSGHVITDRGDLDLSDFPTGLCSVPFKLIWHGNEVDCSLVAGHTGATERASDGALTPVQSWAVLQEPEKKAEQPEPRKAKAPGEAEVFETADGTVFHLGPGSSF